PAPVRITTRTAASAFRSRIARRSSSIVCAFSALSTFGRLMVTTADAPSRSSRRLAKAMATPADQNGNGYISQPRTIADAMKPPNIRPPYRSCARGSSFAITAKISETKNAKIVRSTIWLRITAGPSLPAHRRVVRVDDDEQVQQAGDDQKRAAVLVGHRAHVAAAVPERRRDEIREPDAEVGHRRERDERIAELDRREPAANRYADREHQRKRDEKDETLRPAPEPQVTRAGHCP